MGFFSRHRKAFRSVIASFGILFGLLAGCGSAPKTIGNEPVTSVAKEPSKASIDLGITGLTVTTSGKANFQKVSNSEINCDFSMGYGARNRESKLIFASTLDLAIFSVTVSSYSTYKGTIKFFDEPSLEVGKKYTYKIQKGTEKQVTLNLESQLLSNDTYYARLSISNISLTPIETFSTTFEPNENLGQMYVDGNKVAQSTTMSRQSDSYYTLKFEPVEGYTFLGWDVNGTVESSENPFQFYPKSNNQVIKPKLASSSLANFSVGGIMFSALDEAIAKAKSGSDKTIVAVKDGTVASGNYTLNGGVRLLIPYNSSNVFETTEPEFIPQTSASETNVEFRRLTLKSGTLINVAGGSSISVGSKMYCTGAQYSSYPIGGYGRLELEAGAKVILNSGSNFYCWGFATGDGEIEAKSGANVYEMFQIGGYRGGGATKKIKEENSKHVFPFNQYFVQNIEAKLIIDYGAKEIVTVGIYTNGFIGLGAGEYHSSFCFIGYDNDGMFSLGRGYIAKKYLPMQDRLQIEIHGDGAIRSINFKLGVDFDSSKYVLPIMNNIDIDLAEGDFTVGIEQDVGLLPGSTIKVGKGSKYVIKNNRSVYLYGKDDWKAGYAFNGVTMAPVYYSPTTGSKPKIRKNVVDALFDVNGTVEVQSGCGLYSCVTGNPAPFISSKRTGNVLFASEQAAEIVDQYTHQAEKNEGSGLDVTITYGNIPINRIQFRNGDLSITSDALPANSTVVYDKVLDRWSVSTAHAKKFGLFKTLDGSTVQTVLLHDDIKQSNYTGLFYYSKKTSVSYNAADERYYYLNKGVVSKRNEWWKDTTKGAYYHFGPNQYAYQNVSVVLTSTAGGDNPARGIKARHFFDADAKLLRMVSVTSITSNFSSGMTITNNICYYNGIKAGFGLFENQSHVYLAKDDGSLMKDGTYYVPSHKINNIKDSSGKVLTAGLYYFDENGHMYDSNFKIITRGTAS